MFTRCRRHRFVMGVVAFGGSLATFAPILATGARAEIVGDCNVTVAGQPIAREGLNTVTVKESDIVQVVAISAQPITGYKVELELPFYGVNVEEEPVENETTWTGTIEVDDYATWGAGLYEVRGESFGPGACTGKFLLDVDENPLTTVAGVAAAGAAGVGGAAVAATGVNSMRPPRHSDDAIGDWIMGEMDRAPGGEPPSRSRDMGDSIMDQLERADIGHGPKRDIWTEKSTERGASNLISWAWITDMIYFCSLAAIPAALMTLGMMAIGGGTEDGGGEAGATRSGASGSAPRTPRVPYRPRFTIVGAIGGALTGGGIVTLLQQYGVDPLTEGRVLTAVIGGLVAGFVVPSLFRVVAWLRLRGRVRRVARERYGAR